LGIDYRSAGVDVGSREKLLTAKSAKRRRKGRKEKNDDSFPASETQFAPQSERPGKLIAPIQNLSRGIPRW
jgi:hypothetical protein